MTPSASSLPSPRVPACFLSSRRLQAVKVSGILAGSPFWQKAPPISVGVASSASRGRLTAGRRERNCKRGVRGRDEAQAGA